MSHAWRRQVGEPAVDRGEEAASFFDFALGPSKTSEACRGAKLEGLGPLASGELDGVREASFRLVWALGGPGEQFPLQSAQLGLPIYLADLFNGAESVVDRGEHLLGSSEGVERLGEQRQVVRPAQPASCALKVGKPPPYLRDTILGAPLRRKNPIPNE